MKDILNCTYSELESFMIDDLGEPKDRKSVV